MKRHRRHAMAADHFESLAQLLDSMPNGFPRTESGIELKILRKIFTEEEAEITCALKLKPERPEAIAERLGRNVDGLGDVLEEMVRRGEISGIGPLGARRYHLAPFIVGIYEFNVHRMDKELAELMEHYIAEGLFRGIGNNKPAFMHTVPIGQALTPETCIHPAEDVRRMLNDATVFVTRDCICRKEQEILSHKCEKPRHNCLTMSNNERAFEVQYGGRVITRAEAEKIINEAEEAGLVHAMMNMTGDTHHVCNCCSCCCGLLRGVTKLGAPGMLAASNYWASVDSEACTGCGTCSDERCPAGAIDEHEDGYSVVNRAKCIGCGVCIITCPADSITLVRKPDDQCIQAPTDMVSWMMARSFDTGKPLDKLV